jgi:hypothetical protein
VPSIIFGVGALLLTLFVLQRALPLYGTIWILLIVFVDRTHQLWHADDQFGPDPDPRGAGGIRARERAPPPGTHSAA